MTGWRPGTSLRFGALCQSGPSRSTVPVKGRLAEDSIVRRRTRESDETADALRPYGPWCWAVWWLWWWWWWWAFGRWSAALERSQRMSLQSSETLANLCVLLSHRQGSKERPVKKDAWPSQRAMIRCSNGDHTQARSSCPPVYSVRPNCIYQLCGSKYNSVPSLTSTNRPSGDQLTQDRAPK